MQINENRRASFQLIMQRKRGGGFGGNSGLTNSVNGGIMSIGSDKANMLTAENEQEYGVPYGKDAINADMEYINSKDFAKRFENITDNQNVNRTLLECSRAAIEHRTGTLYEDMYLINGNTGEIMAKQNNTPYEQSINHNYEMEKALTKANAEGIPVVALHTHPEGFPPSVDDFMSAYKNAYDLGVIAGHNGQIYVYYNKTVIVENPKDIQALISAAYNRGYDVDRAY